MVQIDFSDDYKHILLQIPLFRDLDANVKKRLLDELQITLYEVPRKEVVLQQDTRCNHLYILLKGELEVDIIDVAGNLSRWKRFLHRVLLPLPIFLVRTIRFPLLLPPAKILFC